MRGGGIGAISMGALVLVSCDCVSIEMYGSL